MRLIDVEHIPYENGFDRVNGNEHFIFGIETMQEWIMQQPTITPESLVRHGRWVREKDEPPYCSECFEDATFTSGHYYHCTTFCPNCGAKMDLEANHAET